LRWTGELASPRGNPGGLVLDRGRPAHHRFGSRDDRLLPFAGTFYQRARRKWGGAHRPGGTALVGVSLALPTTFVLLFTLWGSGGSWAPPSGVGRRPARRSGRAARGRPVKTACSLPSFIGQSPCSPSSPPAGPPRTPSPTAIGRQHGGSRPQPRTSIRRCRWVGRPATKLGRPSTGPGPPGRIHCRDYGPVATAEEWVSAEASAAASMGPRDHVLGLKLCGLAMRLRRCRADAGPACAAGRPTGDAIACAPCSGSVNPLLAVGDRGQLGTSTGWPARSAWPVWRSCGVPAAGHQARAVGALAWRPGRCSAARRPATKSPFRAVRCRRAVGPVRRFAGPRIGDCPPPDGFAGDRPFVRVIAGVPAVRVLFQRAANQVTWGQNLYQVFLPAVRRRGARFGGNLDAPRTWPRSRIVCCVIVALLAFLPAA